MNPSWKFFLLFPLVLATEANAENSHEAWKNRFIPRDKAEACPSVDIRSKAPAELQQHWNRPRDQDGLGWCYAYAASEVLTAALGVPVSAADLSYSYNFEIESDVLSSFFRRNFGGNKKEEFEGGYVDNMLDYAKDHGVCLESKLPSESYLVSNNTKELKQMLETMKLLRNTVVQHNLSKKDFSDCANCVSKIKDQSFQDFFPGADAEAVYDALTKNKDKQINTAIYNLAQTHCAGNDRMRLPKGMRFWKSSPNQYGAHTLYPEIDAELERGGVVAFATGMKLITKDAGAFDRHAMVIMGREFRNGQCKYLVRNSWGRGCYAYSDVPEIFQDCNQTEGTIWVSEDRLREHMDKIYYLRR